MVLRPLETAVMATATSGEDALVDAGGAETATSPLSTRDDDVPNSDSVALESASALLEIPTSSEDATEAPDTAASEESPSDITTTTSASTSSPMEASSAESSSESSPPSAMTTTTSDENSEKSGSAPPASLKDDNGDGVDDSSASAVTTDRPEITTPTTTVVPPPAAGSDDVDDDDQSVYQIKWAKFHSTETRAIVTQNENGPCPLLAIVNVLLLRGKLKISAGTSIITYGQLMALLWDCILTQV